MKRFILISVIFQVLFFSKSAFASRLVIASMSPQPFSVQVDGRYFGKTGNVFTIDHIRPGLHKVKVYKYFYNGFSQVNTVVYSGFVKVPPHSFVRAHIDRLGKLRVVEIEQMDNPANGMVINGNLNNPPVYNYGMTPGKFEGLKQVMAAQWFDSSRLKIAKQAIRHNGISSEQLLDLMQMFSFESSKLKLAKFAYPYVVDKDNFFIVNNAFVFSSSVNSLNRYIYGL